MKRTLRVSAWVALTLGGLLLGYAWYQESNERLGYGELDCGFAPIDLLKGRTYYEKRNLTGKVVASLDMGPLVGGRIAIARAGATIATFGVILLVARGTIFRLFACLVGKHLWDRCTCRVCGDVRDAEHEARDDDPCCCRRCGRIKHDMWEGVCSRCGAVTCARCNGTGQITCPSCDGRGYTEVSTNYWESGVGQVLCGCNHGSITCDVCNGHAVVTRGRAPVQ